MTDSSANVSPRQLRYWQIVTIALLVTGYAGYYLCRAHFSATKPAIIAEWKDSGICGSADPKVVIGDIAALGTFVYAIGKFLGGVSGDLLGGRRNFLLGMGGAILFTCLFAASSTLPMFTLAWAANRLVQAFGWPGLVKISGRWTHFAAYGSVMGVLSLSYLFGDWASRLFMGALLEAHFHWQQIFYINAAILSGIFLVTLVLLKESPKYLGLPEFPANPANLYADQSSESPLDTERTGLLSVLIPLFKSPAFWLVCLLSLATTLTRETFNDWTPTYFVERLKMDQATAASRSAWFPFLGGISVLVFGFLSDWLGKTGRAVCVVIGLGLTGVALWLLAAVTTELAANLLVPTVAFLLIGPYSFLAGAIALDFGGKKGGATAAGIIDGIGYLGGILAGSYVGRLSSSLGWGAAFSMLAVVIWAATGVGVVYLVFTRRANRPLPALPAVAGFPLQPVTETQGASLP